MAQLIPRQFAKILYQLTQGKTGKELDQALDTFQQYLQEQRATKKLPYILEEFKRYSKQQDGIIEMEVSAARSLSDKTLKEIEKAFDGKVEMTTRIDEGLVGGIIIKTQNRILDGSITTQLQTLKRELL
ncbi:ATP synthase F1 subunit delta [Candidatus Nomurabacteria bacterium]|nr:ATP synthase F1 subunit delta [Candidatus Nomurabacteria bacterium]